MPVRTDPDSLTRTLSIQRPRGICGSLHFRSIFAFVHIRTQKYSSGRGGLGNIHPASSPKDVAARPQAGGNAGNYDLPSRGREPVVSRSSRQYHWSFGLGFLTLRPLTGNFYRSWRCWQYPTSQPSFIQPNKLRFPQKGWSNESKLRLSLVSPEPH